MSASTLTAFSPIAENSEATPGLWNSRFQTLQDNIVSINSVLPGPSVFSGSTWASIGLFANSNNSDYVRFVDTSGQRSTYRIGSNAGGTADGLNIYDESGQTMIASFSKQSIRFYQNVVGPVFDVGGALANTLNAATFGTGADSKESRIQAAISAATASNISRVYVPANLYPYSAGSVTFSTAVQMVREGGDWSVYDLIAYGAYGNGVRNDRAALVAADANGQGYIPGGTYLVNSDLTLSGYWKSGVSGVLKPNSGVTLYIGGAYEAGAYQTLSLASGNVVFNAGSAPYLVAEWFGAKSDGSTLATAALRSAISCAQNSFIRTLRLSAGTYLTADLSITSNGITIEGAGSAAQYGSTQASTTVLSATTGTTTVIDCMPNGGTFADPLLLQIRHLHITGLSRAANGVKVARVTTLEDVSVENCTSNGIWLGQLTNSVRLIRCSSIRNGVGLFTNGGGSTTFSVEASHFHQNTQFGIYMQAGVLARFVDCVIESNAGTGLLIVRPDFIDVQHLMFENCWFEDNSNGGGFGDTIQIDAATRAENNAPYEIDFKNCRINPSGNARRFMLLRSCKNVRFDRCNFDGCTGTDALYLEPEARLVSFEQCSFATDGSAEAQFTNAWASTGATRMFRADREAVYTPTLINSWVSSGIGLQIPQYWHDLQGDVHLHGSMRSGTVGSLSAFTLPLGFRSMATRSFAVSSNSAVGIVQIRPSGAVIPTVGSNAEFSLAGIHFSTAT